MLPPAVLGVVQHLLLFSAEEGATSEALVLVPLFFAFLVITIIVQLVSALALLAAVRQPGTVKESYLQAKSLLLPYLLISILTGIIVMGGFMLLIIPGIIFAVWFSLAPFVLVDEGLRGMNALERSRALISGRWWGVLGRVVVLILAAIIASTVLSFFPQIFSALLLPLIMTPFATLYMYEVYKGLQAEKVGLPAAVPGNKWLYLGVGVAGIVLMAGAVFWTIAHTECGLERLRGEVCISG